MEKPHPSLHDFDALTADIVATPDDYAVWAPYIDACIDYGLDDWAELADGYLRASPEGRAKVLFDNWGKWPLGDALLADLWHKTGLAVGTAFGQSIIAATDSIMRIAKLVGKQIALGQSGQSLPTSGM